ncbi:Pyridoxine/pyridoxamine 5'-phosphate oxidase 1 [Durusdinium trenchii]|uniref:NAD(P)H-hydrate epimerase n=1 Tax=Durusdinium trenchii TaxID=1381693 RepID=A0ABP0LE05_9DINO
MRAFLSQKLAQQLDVELMQQPGFSLDQLMELAGLSVACALAAVWPIAARVLVLCGPGNNGGDGLVAARHLKHFGYEPTIVYPTTPKDTAGGRLYTNILEQCKNLDIPVVREPPREIQAQDFDVVLDAVFGFSFDASRGFRAPFDTVMQSLSSTEVPVASVDIPSGWHVEEGDKHGTGLSPAMLISLTAPKPCAKHFKGAHHFLGGRFLPPKMAEAYNLTGLPKFPGTEQIVRLDSSDTCT